MNFYAKVSLRLAVTFVLSAVAFCIGALLAGAWYNRWVLPSVIKKYPHDGQIGLEAAWGMLCGACLVAAFVFILGMIWTVKTSKRSQLTT